MRAVEYCNARCCVVRTLSCESSEIAGLVARAMQPQIAASGARAGG
jgi:hypothetical protein